MAGARRPDSSKCPACRAPVLTQLVGRTAALNVTADLRGLTPDERTAAHGPNRLIWCLYRAGPHTPLRLRWTGKWHPTNCPHPHVTDHQCPPAEPTTLF